MVYFRTSEEEKALLWLVSTESSPLHPALSTAAAKSITAPVQTAHVERPCAELTREIQLWLSQLMSTPE